MSFSGLSNYNLLSIFINGCQTIDSVADSQFLTSFISRLISEKYRMLIFTFFNNSRCSGCNSQILCLIFNGLYFNVFIQVDSAAGYHQRISSRPQFCAITNLVILTVSQFSFIRISIRVPIINFFFTPSGIGYDKSRFAQILRTIVQIFHRFFRAFKRNFCNLRNSSDQCFTCVSFILDQIGFSGS